MPFAQFLPLIGQGLNAGLQLLQNNAEKKFTVSMYDRQRRDSLADWNMQNAYNSPAEQMKRFKEAGLNPNLIYGQTNTAPAVRSSSAGSWSPKAPQIDNQAVRDSLFYSVDLEQKNAQTNNLKAVADVAAKEAALKAAQTLAVLTGVDKTKIQTEAERFKLNMAMQTMLNDLTKSNISVQQAYANLGNTQTNTANTQQQMGINQAKNEREAAMQGQNIKESMARIALMRAQQGKIPYETENLKAETALKNADKFIKENQKEMGDLDLKLKEKGVQPNDPFYIRIMSRLVDEAQKPSRAPKKLVVTDKFPYFDIVENGRGATGSW